MNLILGFHLLLLAIFKELRGFTVGYVFENTLCGTEGRNRTGTPVKEPDFESGASTSSATPAQENREYSRRSRD